MEVLASLHHSLTYENPSESEVAAQLQMLLQSFPFEKLPTRATLAALVAICGLLAVGEFNPAMARTLRRGDSGEDVLQLQRVLSARGYFSGPFTGLFGSMTQDAVLKLQRSSPGLSVDGVVGPATLAALGTSTSSTPSAALSSGGGGGSSSLRYGSTGAEVRQLQTDLAKAGFYSTSGPFTDYFGELTRSAVVSLQGAYGLTQDGVVGARTRTALSQELQKQSQASSPSTSGSKDKLLRQGSTGPEVTQLQRDLVKAGVYSSAGPFTGYFGELTKGAVIQLQRRYGAQPDGIVGNTTRELVERAMAEAEGIAYGGTSAAPQRSAQATIPQKDQIPEDLPAFGNSPTSEPAASTAADLPLSAYPSPTGYIRLKADLTAYDAPNGAPINYAIATGQVIGYIENKGDGWLKIEVPSKAGSWVFAEPDYSKVEFINAGAAVPAASPAAAPSGAVGGWKQDIESLLNRFRIAPQSTTPDAKPEAAEPALDFGQNLDSTPDYQAWRELTNSVDQLLARYYGASKKLDNA